MRKIKIVGIDFSGVRTLNEFIKFSNFYCDSITITPTFKIPINFEMFQAYTKFLKNIFGFIVDGVISVSLNLSLIVQIQKLKFIQEKMKNLDWTEEVLNVQKILQKNITMKFFLH